MHALCLVSGGLDSTVATWWALEKGWDLTLLTVHYPQRPSREMEATRAIARRAEARLLEVELGWMAELEDPRHPLLENPALDEAPEGYVPARNAILYAVAAHHAELLGAQRIIGGHNGVDPERFPDASGSFFEQLATLLSKGMASGMEVGIQQPLLGEDKAAVVALGAQLDAPLELCWSCYEDGAEPCGGCPSCRERDAAFASNGLEDPAGLRA